MILFEMYIESKAAQRFRNIYSKDQLEDVFNYIVSRQKSLIEYANRDRPALEGIIDALEDRNSAFDLDKYKNRQVLGSMTRFIMGQLDYSPLKSKKMKKGKHLKTALTYKKSL